MSDKLPAPCEHCKATGLFGGSECRECDGKGYRLIIDGRVTPQRLERSGMIRRRTQTRRTRTWTHHSV
jgi:DnaJ-class molecular chaperone